MSLASDVPDANAALWVKFYKRSVQNNFRSAKEGRPCFDDRDFISIISPGDQNNKIDRPATETDKRDFPKQWLNYQNNNSDKVEGTPIEEWPAITRAQADELKYLGIRSIEQLVAASDGQMQKLMGGASLKMKAVAYMKNAKDSAEAQRLADVVATQNAQIESLKAQIAALGAKVEGKAVNSSQTQAIPKRRGRPPKVKAPQPEQGDSQ